MGHRQKTCFLFLIGLSGLIILAVGVLLAHNNSRKPLAADQRVRQDFLAGTIRDLQAMGERSSWEKQAAACSYLEQRLKDLGIPTEIETYSHAQKQWQNIVATFPGKGEHAAELLAVAHYDSKSWGNRADSPGADDNASGVAVLMEIARLLRDIPHQHTIRLVFFSNEEAGTVGSKNFTRKARETGKDIRGAINVDVVGYDAPWELFSREPLFILNEELPVRRRFSMIGKMAMNAFYAPLVGERSLKLMARSEDGLILPVDTGEQTAIGRGRVRWDIGNPCI